MTYPDSPSPQLAGNASDELPLLNSACTVPAPAFVAPLRCAGNLLRQPASLVEGQLLIKQSESAISPPKASESPKMSGTAGKKIFHKVTPGGACIAGKLVVAHGQAVSSSLLSTST